MKRISIVVPSYNEAENIRRVYTELTGVFKELPYELELVYVDDGSSDESFEILIALAREDARVKYVRFVRNFGQQAATAAGLAYATGDAVMLMDADLQHPPALIPVFITAWETGNAIVFGVRRGRADDGFVRRLVSRTFGALMQGSTLPNGTADFCILDRTVVDAFKRLPPQKTMTRIRIAQLNGNRSYIPFDVAARAAGERKYTLRKLIALFSMNVFHSKAIAREPVYTVARTNFENTHG